MKYEKIKEKINILISVLRSKAATIKKYITYLFAFFGLATIGIVLLHQSGYLEVPGAIDKRNEQFALFAKDKSSVTEFLSIKNEALICKINKLSVVEPNFVAVHEGYVGGTLSKKQTIEIIKSAEIYVSDNLKKELNLCDSIKTNEAKETDLYSWMHASEWKVLEVSFSRDKEIIDKVSKETGVPSRMIMSVISGEQLRFFTSARESFKRFYEPFKVFGNLNKFSYGIAGMKPDTARKIEENLTDKKSPWYLGQSEENKYNFEVKPGETKEAARLRRMTSNDHYYPYLYVALFIKQVESHWRNKGFPVENRPEVAATIYNLGLGRSRPKSDPEAGGAKITLLGKTYTFGGIAFEIYHAPVLLKEFPLP